jgi:hypothetical protein
MHKLPDPDPHDIDQKYEQYDNDPKDGEQKLFLSHFFPRKSAFANRSINPSFVVSVVSLYDIPASSAAMRFIAMLAGDEGYLITIGVL